MRRDAVPSRLVLGGPLRISLLGGGRAGVAEKDQTWHGACSNCGQEDLLILGIPRRHSHASSRFSIQTPPSPIPNGLITSAPSFGSPVPPTLARPLPAFGRRPASSRISSASSCCPPPSALRRSAITGRSRRPRHDDSPGLMSERVCGACRRVRRSRLCHTRAPQARDDWRGSRLTKAHGIWPTRRAVIKGRATITPAGMMFDADAPGRGLISSPFRI